MGDDAPVIDRGNPAPDRKGIMLRSKRSKIVAVLGVLALIVAVGAAWAYYGGSGNSAPTQAASAGHAPRAVVVSVQTDTGTIYPGESASFAGEISLTGPGRAHVGSVSAVIDSASLPAGCLASWFPVSDMVLIGGAQEIDAGNPASFTGILNFTDENTLQDACSDAPLKVIVTANPTP